MFPFSIFSLEVVIVWFLSSPLLFFFLPLPAHLIFNIDSWKLDIYIGVFRMGVSRFDHYYLRASVPGNRYFSTSKHLFCLGFVKQGTYSEKYIDGGKVSSSSGLRKIIPPLHYVLYGSHLYHCSVWEESRAALLLYRSIIHFTHCLYWLGKSRRTSVSGDSLLSPQILMRDKRNEQVGGRIYT